MAYKYTYPVVERALRNILVFVFVLMTVVAVVMAIGTVSGVDTSATDAQTIGFPSVVQESVSAQGQEHIDKHVPTVSTQTYSEEAGDIVEFTVEE